MFHKSSPISPITPFVNMILIDFEYFGYCAYISFEALRTQLITNNVLNQGEKDSDFIAIIWLNVSSKK